MTLKTSITIGLAAAMLVFGVEAASAAVSPDQQKKDFWNYDARTGEKVTNSSPDLAPQDLGTLVSTSGTKSRVGARPAASFYTPQALQAMSSNWAAKGRLQSDVNFPPDVFERTVAAHIAALPNVSVYPDAFERAVNTHLATQSNVSTYRDAFERAIASRIESGPLVGHTDRYELDLPNGPVATTITGSGREIEWPQLGIGFGIGMALMIGLILALRLTRSRPLAHG
jgi:hypothetical protein